MTQDSTFPRRLLDAAAPAILVTLFVCGTAASADEPQPSDPYAKIVLADKPVAYWRFENAAKDRVPNQSSEALPGRVEGRLGLQSEGPRPGEFPLFAAENRALDFPGKAGHVRVADPGEHSPLDFDAGDSITLEAWVNPRKLNSGGYAYLVGKGRTQNPKFPADNQNYALRLKGVKSAAAVSFLFRSANPGGDWHRWSSKSTLAVGDGWHHVAVTYTFGKADSLRGYIDGKRVSGVWDMGGATDRAPVVDDDELWFGSSMGGAAGSTLAGQLDEVAIYRTALGAKRIAARYQFVAPQVEVDLARVPHKGVLVDVLEGLPDNKTWVFRSPKLTDSFPAAGLGFVEVPKKYSDRGVQIDRTSPFLIRAWAYVTLPKGPHRILIRSRNASRLYVDERKLAETAFFSISGDATSTVFKVDTRLAPRIRPLQRGDTEDVAMVEGDGQEHLLRFEMIVGGQSHRPELGETGVFIAEPDGDFRMLASASPVWLTDADWPRFAREQRERLVTLNAERRREAGAAEAKYWDFRHKLAKAALAKTAGSRPPANAGNLPAYNDIDRFINRRLQQAGVPPRR